MSAAVHCKKQLVVHAKLTLPRPFAVAFKNFISMPAEPFSALRDGSRNQMVKGVAEKSKRTVLRVIKLATVLAKSAISQARGTGAAPVAVTSTANKTAEDAAFRDLELYLLGQAPLLTGLYNAAAATAVRSREQAQLLLDFGAALRSMGQTEGGALGESFTQVGLASWAASTAAYEAAVCETEAVVEKLADYVRGTRAIRETLDSRSEASAERADCLAEVERLTNLISSLNANPTPQGMKDRAQAETELVEAKKAASEARSEYDSAAAAVVAEVERHRGALLIDFRSMLLDFVTTQVRTEMKLAAAWEKVAGETAGNVNAEAIGVPAGWAPSSSQPGGSPAGLGATGAGYGEGQDVHAFAT